jgi:Uncharacterized protein conserved in bacteria (DUF2059)
MMGISQITAQCQTDARAPVSPAQKKEALLRLLDKMRIQKQMDMLAGIMFAGMAKEAATDADKAMVAELEVRLRRDFLSLAVEAWAKNFTYAETLDLLTFYDSPLGQKFLDAQPKIETDVGLLVQQWMTKTIQEIQSGAKPPQ